MTTVLAEGVRYGVSVLVDGGNSEPGVEEETEPHVTQFKPLDLGARIGKKLEEEDPL